MSKTYKQTHKSIKWLPVLCQRHKNKQTNRYYWCRFCVKDIQTNKHIDKIISGSVSKTCKQTNISIKLFPVLCQRRANKQTNNYYWFRFCVKDIQTNKQSIKLLSVLCQRHTNKLTNRYYYFRFFFKDIQTNGSFQDPAGNFFQFTWLSCKFSFYFVML